MSGFPDRFAIIPVIYEYTVNFRPGKEKRRIITQNKNRSGAVLIHSTFTIVC